MKIILASQSQRRQELLKLMGITDFEVIPSNIEEKLNDNLNINDRIIDISYNKAKNVFDRTAGDRIIISADTIVEKNDIIYGKPKSEENAMEMLKLFRNSKVNVITGITVLTQYEGQYIEKSDYDLTEVYIKNMADQEILNWINTGEALDKAGAFAIQCAFCVFIEKIVGNYDNVVGLPTSKLYDMIKEYNI